MTQAHGQTTQGGLRTLAGVSAHTTMGNTVKKSACALALLPLLILTACSGLPPAENGANADIGATAGADAGTPDLAFEDLPDCGLVTENSAELIGDFLPSPEGVEDVFIDDTQATLNCSWVTPETIGGDAYDIGEFGGLGIGVLIDKVPSTRADLEAAGLARDYPAADNAGATVASFDKDFDPAGELSGLGVTVYRGNVSIVVTAVGIYLDPSNIVGARTNADAIDAALRIHEAMRAD